MKTNLQPILHTPGQEETQEKIQETTGKVQTSQGLVLTGDKLEEFKRMALNVVEGNNEVIKMLDDLEEEKERKRLKEKKEKLTLEEICQLLRDSGHNWQITNANLIEKSGNIDEKDNTGDTVLHNSSRLGLTNIVDKLLKAGADIEARNNGGWTPLIAASFNGQIETIKLLLDRGAKVNKKDIFGRTALSLANNEETRDLLISYGAIE